MVSDSFPTASIATPTSNPKDFAKKKRANRSAKLRQYKLDARREQWLSQVKKKEESTEEVNGVMDKHQSPVGFADEEKSMPVGRLEIHQTVGKENSGGGLSVHCYSESESSPSNSPTSQSSSILGSNGSSIKFTASSGSNSGRSSSSSNDFFPCSSMSEDGEGDGCLDDWEAMADALSAPENKKQDHSSEIGLLSSGNCRNSAPHGPPDVISNGKQETGGTRIRASTVHSCAWRADDAFRPQSLPNLQAQHFNRGQSTWCHRTDHPIPASCPICYEDFDFTDSNFFPCSCGFRVCLFCHKTILEGDGRCPGCRKQYDPHRIEGEPKLHGRKLTFRLSHSHKMCTKP